MLCKLIVCFVFSGLVIAELSGGGSVSSSMDQPLSQSIDESPVGTQEHCWNEVFEVKCLKTEVIVMKSAQYGRMRIGRCLQTSSSFGCSVDVLPFMDSKCSGRNQCDVRVTDVGSQQESPCHADLKTYMEASYECVTVIEPDRSCSIVITSSSTSHVMPPSTTKLNCGTKTQPWVLDGTPGQQIEVTLRDFSLKSRIEESPGIPVCSQYGYILEKSGNRNESICALSSERKKVIYKSSTNKIEIILSNENSHHGNNERQNYLVGFKAIGCINITPPEDAWLKRVNNEATVGCYTSRRLWHLRCVDNHWIGVIGNCSVDVAEVGADNVHQTEMSFINPHTVIIIVVIGILALIICAAVICAGFVCLKRHYAISVLNYCHQVDDNGKSIRHSSNNEKSSRPILVQHAA